MKKIYSKINETKLLHIIVRKNEINPGREDIVSEENFIQCSRLNLTKGTTFKPHKHIWKKRNKNFVNKFQYNKYGSFVRKKIIKYIGKNPNITDTTIVNNSKNFIN